LIQSAVHSAWQDYAIKNHASKCWSVFHNKITNIPWCSARQRIRILLSIRTSTLNLMGSRVKGCQKPEKYDPSIYLDPVNSLAAAFWTICNRDNEEWGRT